MTISAHGNFYVKHTGSEWVVWGPMGDLERAFVGAYSGHTTSSEAYAALRRRKAERVAYEGRATQFDRPENYCPDCDNNAGLEHREGCVYA